MCPPRPSTTARPATLAPGHPCGATLPHPAPPVQHQPHANQTPHVSCGLSRTAHGPFPARLRATVTLGLLSPLGPTTLTCLLMPTDRRAAAAPQLFPAA